jgi:hypothetical protein
VIIFVIAHINIKKHIILLCGIFINFNLEWRTKKLWWFCKKFYDRMNEWRKMKMLDGNGRELLLRSIVMGH